MSKKAQPNPIQTLPPSTEPRLRLAALQNRLTAQQRSGLLRIVEADLCGLSLDSLLESGPRQMCAHTTYYGAGGWSHNPDFVEALRCAREIDFDSRLKAFAQRARERIFAAAPDAAGVLVAMIAMDVDGKTVYDPQIALRASCEVLNRTDKTTANQAPVTAVVTVTADEMAAARDEAAKWEKEQFGGG